MSKEYRQAMKLFNLGFITEAEFKKRLMELKSK